MLLAHNIYEQDVLLHRIKFLKNGDKIYTTDFKDVYVYTVSLNKVVEETEVSYIAKNKPGAAPKITLLRCEGQYRYSIPPSRTRELQAVEPIQGMDQQEMVLIRIKTDDRKIRWNDRREESSLKFKALRWLLRHASLENHYRQFYPCFYSLCCQSYSLVCFADSCFQ